MVGPDLCSWTKSRVLGHDFVQIFRDHDIVMGKITDPGTLGMSRIVDDLHELSKGDRHGWRSFKRFVWLSSEEAKSWSHENPSLVLPVWWVMTTGFRCIVRINGIIGIVGARLESVDQDVGFHGGSA